MNCLAARSRIYLADVQVFPEAPPCEPETLPKPEHIPAPDPGPAPSPFAPPGWAEPGKEPQPKARRFYA